jgi:small-conductance mechanosensitive channel
MGKKRGSRAGESAPPAGKRFEVRTAMASWLTTGFWAREIAGNPLWAWFMALGILLAVLGFLLLVRLLLFRGLARRFQRRGTMWAQRGADLTRRTTFLFLLVVALFAASQAIALPAAAERAIRSLAVTIFLVQIGLWGNGLIANWVQRLAERRRKEGDTAAATTLSSAGLLVRILLWVLVLLLILQNLGVNVTAMLAGLGIVGVAIAFAAQSLLADLFAFLAIVIDQPFLVGDFIATGNISGTVERIGLKTTRIRSLSGEEVVVANSELLRGWIHDYTRVRERWVLFTFAVSYDTPTEKLAVIPGLVQEVVAAVPNTRFDRAHFKEYGEFGLLFEVAFYVQSPRYRDLLDARHAVNLGLHRRFAAEGIRFAFPIRRIIWEREEEKDELGEASRAASGRAGEPHQRGAHR